jgi:hypothetical protein
MRGIYFVLAYTTHNYEYMTDLSETPVFPQDSDVGHSPQHFQFLVKVKPEAKAVPLHAKQAYMGDRGLTLSMFDPGLGRVGGQGQAPADLPSGENLVSNVQETGWASRLVCMGPEKIAHAGFRAPDSPARRGSLYPLYYAGSLLSLEDYKLR